MESIEELAGEAEEPHVAWWKRPLWRMRLVLWAVAVVTFTWEQLASSPAIAFGDTPANARWLGQQQGAYADSLQCSLVVALLVAGALLALSIACFVRKQAKLAVLDLCTIPVMLVWCAMSLATLALSAS